MKKKIFYSIDFGKVKRMKIAIGMTLDKKI